MSLDFLDEYDFPLDESQIAKYPAKERDESKLLVLKRQSSTITEHKNFREITSYLRSGDVLVYNETKVSKRRVFLETKSGRKHESIFLESRDPDGLEWLCILKNRKKLKLVESIWPIGETEISFSYTEAKEELSLLRSSKKITEEDFEKWGKIPIPPYLKREATEDDEERYQTIFAKNLGSVAAPTAGLHFTNELKEQLLNIGVQFVPINLEIGYGTFQPLSEAQVVEKKLHKEKYFVSLESAELLTLARREGRRIISIGTTSLRVLETIYENHSQLFVAGQGETDIFVSPGDEIHSIDGLVTNFHLPRSSLLLLVSTFAGKELIMKSYHHALDNGFRFYSYGDTMFVL